MLFRSTLLENRISESLFDEVIRIDREKEKRDYIHYEKSIFIDDSFSERKKISQACNIPVFDCSEVEALLDWRV